MAITTAWLNGILDEVDGLCAADKANLSSTIFSECFITEDFARHHEVMTGVSNGSLIPIIGNTADACFLKTSPGNCGFNDCDITPDSSAKKWAPVRYNCSLQICDEDLTCDFRKFFSRDDCGQMGEDAAFIRWLMDLVVRNVNESNWRIAYFDALAGEDGFNGIDGIFAQLDASPITGVGGPNHFVIPDPVTPQDAKDTLAAMYDAAGAQNSCVLDKPGIHFDVTPEFGYAYLSWLRDNKEATCCFDTRTTDGVTSSRFELGGLNYLGIPVNIRYEWKRAIDCINATGPVVPIPEHKALLTWTGNKPVGVCSLEDLSRFDLFTYRSPNSRLLVMQSETELDAKIIVEEDAYYATS